eukprot:m.269697 g.269697  ORF g.269697 m.269697 type:complete len:487 (-) comp19304_c5_seq1:440-1900(-)
MKAARVSFGALAFASVALLLFVSLTPSAHAQRVWCKCQSAAPCQSPDQTRACIKTEFDSDGEEVCPGSTFYCAVATINSVPQEPKAAGRVSGDDVVSAEDDDTAGEEVGVEIVQYFEVDTVFPRAFADSREADLFEAQFVQAVVKATSSDEARQLGISPITKGQVHSTAAMTLGSKTRIRTLFNDLQAMLTMLQLNELCVAMEEGEICSVSQAHVQSAEASSTTDNGKGGGGNSSAAAPVAGTLGVVALITMVAVAVVVQRRRAAGNTPEKNTGDPEQPPHRSGKDKCPDLEFDDHQTTKLSLWDGQSDMHPDNPMYTMASHHCEPDSKLYAPINQSGSKPRLLRDQSEAQFCDTDTVNDGGDITMKRMSGPMYDFARRASFTVRHDSDGSDFQPLSQSGLKEGGDVYDNVANPDAEPSVDGNDYRDVNYDMGNSAPTPFDNELYATTRSYGTLAKPGTVSRGNSRAQMASPQENDQTNQAGTTSF